MRALVFACILCLAAPSALAEEPGEDRHVESETEIGFVADGGGRFGHRVLTRLFLNVGGETNAFEAHYGLAWKMREHAHLDLTLGYVFADEGPDASHAIMLGVWKEARFGRWRFRTEQAHLYDGDYRYEGFYAVDYQVAGIHLANRGTDAAAGIQFGSGVGLDPFRVEIRLTHGITDGFPESAGRFFMSLDFR